MKIRNGHVSNSSSSSFFVFFLKKPKTIEQLVTALFGDQKEYPNPYTWGSQPSSFPVQTVADSIFKQFDYNRRKVLKELHEEIRSDISYQINEIARSNVRNGCSSYVIENEQMVGCDVVADRAIDVHIANLTKHFPRTNWKKKFETILAAKTKHEANQEKMEKLAYSAEKKAITDAGIEEWVWKNTSNMSKEEATAYEKAQAAYHNMRDKALKNSKEYQKANDNRISSWSIMRELPELNLITKKLIEILLIENKGRTLARIEIADGSNMGSAMEHGTLFDRVNHKRFSHH